MDSDVKPQLKAPFRRRLGTYVRNPNFVLLLTGLIASLAFLMLVCFGVLTWYGRDTNTISAFKIWLGGNEAFPSLSLDSLTHEQSGISHVRFLDRLLIIVPLGVVTLFVLVGMVILEKMPVEQGFGAMLAVSILLLLFPFFWQSLSTSNWRDYLEDHQFPQVDATLDQLSDLYSTGEQKFFGLLLVIVSSTGFGLHVAEKHGLLGTPAPTPLPTEHLASADNETTC